MQQASPEITMGSSITVKGKIQEFRETRGLVVHSFSLETNPNAEWIRWLELVKSRKRTLNSPPPVLPPHLAAEKEDLLRPTAKLSSSSKEASPLKQPFETQLEVAMEGFCTEQDFLGLVLSWASTNCTTFTYSQMVSDPRLLRAAHRVFETQHGTLNPSKPRLHSLFKRTIRGLVVSGHMYLSCPESDAYSLILEETLDKELLHWFSSSVASAGQGMSCIFLVYLQWTHI